jgi:TfoX/Sxy family transcriptional regulator of competence genes
MVTAENRQLLDRIRGFLPDLPVREVPMFGAVAVMLDEAMVVAVRRDGSVLVRVDPDEDPELLERPEASRAEMGTGRSMGVGWMHVDGAAIEDDENLEDWVMVAVRYRQRRPGKRR